MASFTSLGVGSGLPLDTLLNNLTIAEKKRLNPITQQQTDNTARLTAYGTLKSALEKFQTHQPNIIICDIKMPKMDGISAASVIAIRSVNGA